uniref:O-acyltransferase WSD1 C-terminal domain-containing protein n=2 Tax=Opuntia streptacantha TaxID=393608 RepID=A0A7C8ZM17_OPUST
MMRANTWWCGSSSWGNKTGAILQPIHCCNGLHPLDHVKRMKAIMDQKKHSYEAHVSFLFAKLILPCLGPKAVSWYMYRSTCSTTFIFSNIVGPSEELMIAGNPVTYIRVNISSTPHALVVYMVSYAGMVDLQVMVAEDIIPDSQFLVECFKESFLEMKNSNDRGGQNIDNGD